MTLDAEEIVAMFGLEERVYRFRCVEAWAMIVPWTGFQLSKFVDKQPGTFWETLAPDEYPFESNVNPKVPHPRWSQAFERMIDTDDRIRTQLYNGYASQVAKLYERA